MELPGHYKLGLQVATKTFVALFLGLIGLNSCCEYGLKQSNGDELKTEESFRSYLNRIESVAKKDEPKRLGVSAARSAPGTAGSKVRNKRIGQGSTSRG